MLQFSPVILIAVFKTHLARAYLSLPAWRESDWLQMTLPSPWRQAVECPWPNLREEELVVREDLQSGIQLRLIY